MANEVDFGWAYIAQNVITGAGGPLGSIQFNTDGVGISGSNALTYDYATTTLILSGSLFVSGAISANTVNLDVTNRTVTNLTATGSTKFGDSADDTHVLTGSTTLTGSNPLTLLGLSSGSLAGLGSYLGLNSNNQLILTSSAQVSLPVTALNNKAVNRLVSIGATTTELDGEANLTFDGSKLSVTGELTSSIGVSASIGRYTELTSSNIKATGVTATTIAGTLSTAAQTNVTSVGDLTGLTVDTTTFVVNGTSNKVAIGRAAADKKLEVVDNSDSQLRLTHTTSPARYTDFRSTSDGYLNISPSGGRVGIGTTIPTAELAITGAAHISGNLGVGTTSPAYKLDVGGNARITGNLIVSGTLNARVTDFQVSANTLTLGDASGDAITINAATVAAPNGLNFDSNTFVIDAGNNRVGIGIANPTYDLEVAGNAGIDEYIYHNDDADTYLRFQDDDLEFQVGGKSMIKIDEDTKSKILLNKDGDSTSVGIGTDNPEAELHVSGTIIAIKNVAVTGSITGSALTDGTVKIAGGNILSVGTLSATNITGTLGTAAQTNITSVGNLSGLTVDSTTLVVNGTSNKVAIGRAAADKKLEVVDSSDAQLRLTHTTSPAKHVDFRATSDGNLYLAPNGNQIGIGTALPTQTLSVSGTFDISASANPMKIYGLQSATATTSSFLALDSNNNLILTSSGTVLTEYVSASILTYTNPGNNRLVTSVNATSVNSEANLTFDGTDLTVGGGGSIYVDKIRRSSDSGTTTKILLDDEQLKFYTGHASDEVVNVQSGVVTIDGRMTGLSSLTSSVINNDHLTSSFGKFTTVNATNLAGTLTTAAQTNITSVGNLASLTADSTTLVVKATTSRVGIGRSGPVKKLEVSDNSAAQMRLTHTNDSKFTDFHTTTDGYLIIDPSHDRIGIGTTTPTSTLALSGTLHISASSNPVKLMGIQSGSLAGEGSYLGLDATGQLVITASSGGTVTINNDANNRVVTAGGDSSINGEANLLFDGNTLTVNGGVTFKRRAVTSATTASLDDYYLGVSASSPLQIRLPGAEGLTAGQTYTIKDEAGNAGVNNITVLTSGSQKIDGVLSVTLESPYAAINLYTNGVDQYFVF